MAEHAVISFYRGEDVSLVVTMSPVTDITGWTIQLTFKTALTDTTSLLTKSATLTTPEDGVFTATLSRTETLEFSAGRIFYAFARTDTGSEVVLNEGLCNVKNSAAL